MRTIVPLVPINFNKNRGTSLVWLAVEMKSGAEMREDQL